MPPRKKRKSDADPPPRKESETPKTRKESETLESEEESDFQPSEHEENEAVEEEDEEEQELRTREERVPVKEVEQLVNTTPDKKQLSAGYYVGYTRHWSPDSLYRMPADIVGKVIRESGNEGLDRIEIAKRIGIDAQLKGGNRRVSAHIQMAAKLYPQHIGQYQKMEGKYRTIKYYWKEANTPARFQSLYDRFEAVNGGVCPFKMGQVIKFPHSTLSTLRVSDVTLFRLVSILEFIERKRVIVTIHKLMKMVHEDEQNRGYKFQIDKKSLIKCLKALEQKELIKVFTRIVSDESITIVAHRDIRDELDEEIDNCVERTVDEYNREGRVFPHGQLRYSAKKIGEIEKAELKKTEERRLETIEEDVSQGVSLADRYDLWRLQASRNAARTKSRKKGDEDEDEDGSKGKYDPGLSLGYQAKMMRCMLIHELVFQMTRGLPEGTSPTVFDKFPPGVPEEEWPELDSHNMHVYVDEESPLRFVPPASFRGMPRGWFMLADVYAAMPLSIFILIAKPYNRIERELMLNLLSDPIRRHTPLGNLPSGLRHALLNDRKAVKMVEHLCFLLCAMGLMGLAPNPSPKRFSTSATSVFFLVTRTSLRDTSRSERGYSTVTPPMEQYPLYEYEFDSLNDIYTFWHHLRAIVQSTPLAFRIDVNSKGQARQYAIGTFDKESVLISPDVEYPELLPTGERDGVGGYDSGLFIHLQRHWDPNPRPSAHVSWFFARFRKFADSIRSYVEERVEKLEGHWNSFVKSLMPSEIELYRDKKSSIRTAIPNLRSINNNSEMKKKKRIAGEKKAKKRPLDSVDLVSQSNRVNVRSRFNSRERDMLILIRAVGFFLNPVYRFWLNPTVLRDIMHEYVPESRTKTVQSLMAAGVREMVRPHRLAYLQRIVKNLSTFPEMHRLRMQLSSSPLNSTEEKTIFFRNAFDLANRLLFLECHDMPAVSASSSLFESFLSSGNVSVSSEPCSSRPIRSQSPSSVDAIQHSVCANVLVATLLHSASFSERLLEQANPASIQQALHVLRSDGLVSRVRFPDGAMTTLGNKNQATLSFYFRTFFCHRYQSEFVDLLFSQMMELEEEGQLHLNGDDIGSVILLLSSFYLSRQLSFSVDEDIVTNFEKDAEQNVTKQIRYLECADLQLEKISVTIEDHTNDKNYVSLDNILERMNRSHPIVAPVPLDEFVSGRPGPEVARLRAVHLLLEQAGPYGCSLPFLEEKMHCDTNTVRECLAELVEGGLLCEGGVDTHRYMLSVYSELWNVEQDARRVCVRPWTHPDGGVSRSTIRWMAENLLVQVASQPGLSLSALSSKSEFVLQPVAVLELIEMLELADCVRRVSSPLREIKLKGPFDNDDQYTNIEYLMPTIDCFERFSYTFGSYPLTSLVFT